VIPLGLAAITRVIREEISIYLDLEGTHMRKEETCTPEMEILSEHREQNDQQAEYLGVQINFLLLRKAFEIHS
jgi:hypothetical protein